MPCNAVSMRTATVKVDAILKTEQGLTQLTKFVEQQLSTKVTSQVDIMLRQIRQSGNCYMNTEIGAIRFWLDKDVYFPASMTNNEEAKDRFIAAYNKFAGKFQQMIIAAMIKKAAGNNVAIETSKNGSLIVRGELSL